MVDGLEQVVREWQAERAIARVILDYGLGVDHRNHARVRACFHSDARIDYGCFAGDPDALVDWLERIQPLADRTWHGFGSPRIELALERGSAEVETYCTLVNVLPRGADGVARQTLAGLRFFDRFEAREGIWRIAERRNVADWSQSLQRSRN